MRLSFGKYLFVAALMFTASGAFAQWWYGPVNYNPYWGPAGYTTPVSSSVSLSFSFGNAPTFGPIYTPGVVPVYAPVYRPAVVYQPVVRPVPIYRPVNQGPGNPFSYSYAPLP